MVKLGRRARIATLGTAFAPVDPASQPNRAGRARGATCAARNGNAKPAGVRTIFFGTPAIAVPALEALAETSEVVGVVCQPDRPAGRGMKLRAPSVKLRALELGLEVHQPKKVRTGTLHEWIAERGAEAAIVLAYGRILPGAVLRAPRRGCLNLHASILPRYRGAAPINWAIIRGEQRTGISLMQMDEGLDTGPVFTTRELAIGPDETAGELAERIAQLAATVVREDVPRAIAGELTAAPQDHSLATHAPPLEAEHLQVDWSAPAASIAALVRGLAPRPTARTTVDGKLLKLHSASAEPADGNDTPPGTILLAEKAGIVVATGGGRLVIQRAQLEGRRALDAADLVNGRALAEGQRLGD